MVEQVSVFLENSTGSLAELTRALGDAGIDMHALMVADTESFGVVRIICDTPRAARDILEGSGFSVTLDAGDRRRGSRPTGWPGRRARGARRAEKNVEYAYCFVEPSGHAAVDVLKVDDASAEDTLAGRGFQRPFAGRGLRSLTRRSRRASDAMLAASDPSSSSSSAAEKQRAVTRLRSAPSVWRTPSARRSVTTRPPSRAVCGRITRKRPSSSRATSSTMRTSPRKVVRDCAHQRALAGGTQSREERWRLARSRPRRTARRSA